MLKATLFTIICGLLGAQLPAVTALAGVALLSIIEVGLLAWWHGHSPLHYGGAFVLLYFLGEFSVLAGLLWRNHAVATDEHRSSEHAEYARR